MASLQSWSPAIYAALKPEFRVRSNLLADRMVFWNEYLPSQEEGKDLLQNQQNAQHLLATTTKVNMLNIVK